MTVNIHLNPFSQLEEHLLCQCRFEECHVCQQKVHYRFCLVFLSVTVSNQTEIAVGKGLSLGIPSLEALYVMMLLSVRELLC